MKTEARVIADSVCQGGPRITTFLVTAPRIILAEINTHKILCKNAASSRAIPVKRRVEMVREGGFTPTFWGANQPGMQAAERITDENLIQAKQAWKTAMLFAAACASNLDMFNVHKSIANRVIEPYTWCSQIITGTEWANHFNLRVDAMAQDEYHEMAGWMLKAYVESTPQELAPGEWHCPFGDQLPEGTSIEVRLKVSAARLGRLSVERHDGDFSIEKDVEFTETKLLAPGHMSPTEHAAQAAPKRSVMYPHSEDGRTGHPMSFGVLQQILRQENAHWDGSDFWWGPFRGWRQYRKTLPGENRSNMNPQALLAGWEQRRKERGYV